MIPKLEPYDAYAAAHSQPEPDVLRRLRLETERNHPMAGMMSGPVQGRLLALLTRLARARSVLEIGTFVGYGALCFAEAIGPGGRVVTLDRDPASARTAAKYFAQVPYGRRITQKLGNALASIRSLRGPFDLVYIDADKPNYSRYYDAVLPKVRRGGLIVADNLFWSGAVLKRRADRDALALRAFAKKVAADRGVEPVLLTVRDGLMVIRKR